MRIRAGARRLMRVCAGRVSRAGPLKGVPGFGHAPAHLADEPLPSVSRPQANSPQSRAVCLVDRTGQHSNRGRQT